MISILFFITNLTLSSNIMDSTIFDASMKIHSIWHNAGVSNENEFEHISYSSPYNRDEVSFVCGIDISAPGDDSYRLNQIMFKIQDHVHDIRNIIYPESCLTQLISIFAFKENWEILNKIHFVGYNYLYALVNINFIETAIDYLSNHIKFSKCDDSNDDDKSCSIHQIYTIFSIRSIAFFFEYFQNINSFEVTDLDLLFQKEQKLELTKLIKIYLINIYQDEDLRKSKTMKFSNFLFSIFPTLNEACFDQKVIGSSPNALRFLYWDLQNLSTRRSLQKVLKYRADEKISQYL